jgi:hypothetical protein
MMGNLRITKFLFCLIIISTQFGLSIGFEEHYEWQCDISNNPIQTLKFNVTLGQYLLVEKADASETDGPPHLRQLDENRDSRERATGLTTQNRRAAASVLHVRACTCIGTFSELNQTVYCPSATTHCVAWHNIPECLTIDRSEIISKRVWPIVLLFFTLLIVALFATFQGWHAMDFCWAKLYPERNDMVARNFIRSNPYLANVYVQNYMRNYRRDELAEDYLERQNEHNCESLPRPPNQLALKTRVFRDRTFTGETTSMRGDGDSLSLASSSSDEQQHCCTICFSELEAGDRVGALPCDHVFHVDCLKGWLRRRNVCPLCLMENVATPEHVENVATIGPQETM